MKQRPNDDEEIQQDMLNFFTPAPEHTCPDCGKPIPKKAVCGSKCKRCGCVFLDLFPEDDFEE